MANVQITYGQVVTRDVFALGSCRSEVIVSSGTTAASALTVNLQDRVQIFCATAILVSEKTPVVAATSLYVEPGVVNWFAARENATIYVIDAP